MKGIYKIGDACYIAPADENDKLRQGVVVHKFKLPGWIQVEHYVIEIDMAIEPLLEVRDALTMSDSADGPLGWLALVHENRSAQSFFTELAQGIEARSGETPTAARPEGREPGPAKQDAP